MLSTAKNNALAELFRDIGSIFFATVFLAPLFDKPNFFGTMAGLTLSTVSWYFGIKLIKG